MTQTTVTFYRPEAAVPVGYDLDQVLQLSAKNEYRHDAAVIGKRCAASPI